MKHFPRNIPLTAISLATVALIAACGGGGGSTSAGPMTLAGAVIDGYVTGANVCLDLNSNGACDSGEPSATSVANGKYSLTAPAGTNLANLHIIATVPAGAVDSDAPSTPIAHPYKMLAPADMPTVVSPLTTVISTKMLASSLSLANARIAARTDLALPVDYDFTKDHVATNDVGARNVAKVMAAILAVKVGTDTPNATRLGQALTQVTTGGTAATAYASTNVSAMVSGILGSPTPTPTPTPTPSPSGSTGTCTTTTSQNCLTFGEATMAFEAFEGLGTAMVAVDPVDSGNTVAKFVKVAAGQPWAGATLYTTASNKSVPRVGFATSKIVTLRVYSPAVGEKIRLKFEDAADNTKTIEVDATTLTTQANSWETLTFDFSTPASGTAAYNAATTYNKVSVFPKFLTAVGSDTTYYFDELKYAAHVASPTPTPSPSGSAIVFASGYTNAGADNVNYTKSGTSVEGGDVNWYQDSVLNDWSNFWWNGFAPSDATPSFYFGVGLASSTNVPYIAAYVNAPNNGSVTLGGQTKLRIALWGNDELTSRSVPTYKVVVQLKQSYSGCYVEAESPLVTPPSIGVQTYNINLTNFSIKNNCAGSGVSTAASLLAQPIGSVHVQLLKANMYFSGSALSPNGMNIGPISFQP